MFKAIEKDSVPVQIVNYFLNSISSKELKENDRLPPERDLCELLSVGRSTLREALRILEMMNVIEKRNDGTYVRIQNEDVIKEAVSIDFAVGINNYAELVEVRNFLEVETVVLAAENHNSEDLKKLDELCKEMRKVIEDVKQYAKYGTEFHIAIAEATHNDILTEIFEAIRYVMYDYQKNNMKTNDEVRRSYKEHLELLSALKESDPVKCEDIMRRHLDYTQNLFERKSSAEPSDL
ncbi:HTH-type transcriptional regulator LutR [bioreactor metagenome]|uniref:HTH-type transcriptional regulator LutR n=1 Tax=bioreactor metagenome TaxID=1076179 RepID=A0A644W9J4_9ZZZZ